MLSTVTNKPTHQQISTIGVYFSLLPRSIDSRRWRLRREDRMQLCSMQAYEDQFSVWGFQGHTRYECFTNRQQKREHKELCKKVYGSGLESRYYIFVHILLARLQSHFSPHRCKGSEKIQFLNARSLPEMCLCCGRET